MVERRLPNFIICGGQRCGTGWIAQCLREHPEVFVANDETRFFDLHYQLGLSWWLDKYFAGSQSAKAIGEKTAEYLYAEEVPDRIFSLLDTPKIIICVRDPVTRLASEIAMKSRLTKKTMNATLDDVLNTGSNTLLRSRYSTRITLFNDRAKSERTLIVVYEELKENPEDGFKRIFEFLNVNPDYSPKSLWLQIKPGAVENSNTFLYFFSRMLLRSSHFSIKFFSQLRKSSNSGTKAIEERIRKLDLYSEEVVRMESILGRRLNVWRKK